ncbi:MAG: hypothetical protein ACREJU_17525 [Nitrospiraceae bacterium]
MGYRLGREVTVQQLPLSAVVPTFTSMGYSENAARLFQDMYAGLANGHIVFEGNGAAQPRGIVALSEALSG